MLRQHLGEPCHHDDDYYDNDDGDDDDDDGDDYHLMRLSWPFQGKDYKVKFESEVEWLKTPCDESLFALTSYICLSNQTAFNSIYYTLKMVSALEVGIYLTECQSLDAIEVTMCQRKWFHPPGFPHGISHWGKYLPI